MPTEQELISKLRETLTPREWGQALLELCNLRGIVLNDRSSGKHDRPGLSTICDELGISRTTARQRIAIAKDYETMTPAAKALFDSRAKRMPVRFNGVGGRGSPVVFSFTGGPTASEAHKFRVTEAVHGEKKSLRHIDRLKKLWIRLNTQTQKSFLKWLYDRGELVELPTERLRSPNDG